MTPFDTCKAWKEWHDRQRPLLWAMILGIVAGTAGSFMIMVRELVTAGGLPLDWMVQLVECFAGALSLAFLVGMVMEWGERRQQRAMQ